MHACHKDPKVNRWGKFSAILGVVWLVIFIIAIAAWVSAIGQMASAIGGIYGGGGSSSSGTCCRGTSSMWDSTCKSYTSSSMCGLTNLCSWKC